MDETTFKAGDKVRVFPQMTPNCSHDGEVLRKTKYGYSIKYCAWGMWFKDTFTPARIKKSDCQTTQ